LLVGYVMAEEFTLNVTAINDDGSITGTKGFGGFGGFGGKGGAGGKGGKGEPITVKLAKDVTVTKGKFDLTEKKFVADGENVKAAGLRAAFATAQNGSVSVAGKALTGSDKLELSIQDGKPAAKLNGKDVPFTDVSVKGKGNLTVRVTTNDDGVATNVMLTTGGFGGLFGGGKGGKGGATPPKTVTPK
jgi:hypothetical protein